MNDSELIWKRIIELEDWVVAIRRDLHRHPELGTEEHWTSERIAGLLREMAIPFQRMAGTGIVGLIGGGRPGKTVALRADMDGLPIQEATDLEYASLHPGKMHACGHDAHTAILIGAARVLNDMKERLAGTVKLFFQPAEETDGGAKPMIEAGCMKDPNVDYVLGLHVTPYAEAGQVLIRYGKITAASDIVKLSVQGRSSHAAYPEESVDAIVIAAQLITALQTIVSRNLSPLDSGVLTFGTIRGGVKENVIADEVSLTGTIRTLDPQTRRLMKERVAALVANLCQAMGGSGTVRFEEGYPPTINHDEVTRVVEANAKALLGVVNVLDKEHPSMGVEDFSYFCQAAPGAFYYLGCGNRAQGITAPGHHPGFRIDETCLRTGIWLQVINTLTLLEKG